ncbi:Anaerobic ribonucleoside-triphosphate reductase-activating protein [Tumidithrix helvetica PCC 7403]|uniref:4Fe-4S single cluster domain-containing protein n=1 Tax=Tumidithrix helvetica TaxID=3457545 RepID=UPI003C979E2E
MRRKSLQPNIDLLKIPTDRLNLMGYVNESEVNGPGCRAVVWVQGCLRRCPKCFNPASWSFEFNQLIPVEDLTQQILSNPRNTGVTFSGGEPFWQAPALTELARQVKAAGLNVMSFTGFTLEELSSPGSPPGAAELLAELDLLLDGPYVESLAVNIPSSPVSSSNQRLHIFNPQLQNQVTWASDRIEVHILKNGDRLFTGYRRYEVENN